MPIVPVCQAWVRGQQALWGTLGVVGTPAPYPFTHNLDVASKYRGGHTCPIWEENEGNTPLGFASVETVQFSQLLRQPATTANPAEDRDAESCNRPHFLISTIYLSQAIKHKHFVWYLTGIVITYFAVRCWMWFFLSWSVTYWCANNTSIYCTLKGNSATFQPHLRHQTSVYILYV